MPNFKGKARREAILKGLLATLLFSAVFFVLGMGPIDTANKEFQGGINIEEDTPEVTLEVRRERLELQEEVDVYCDREFVEKCGHLQAGIHTSVSRASDKSIYAFNGNNDKIVYAKGSDIQRALGLDEADENQEDVQDTQDNQGMNEDINEDLNENPQEDEEQDAEEDNSFDRDEGDKPGGQPPIPPRELPEGWGD